jgi:hypothetical protein
VRHVIRTDGGFILGTGTRWDIHDIYADWISSKNWDVRVRAALETDGEPDYNGKPVLYDLKWIRRKRRDPNSSFPSQMMNDPSPEKDKPWKEECEHEIEMLWEDIEKNPGQIFVLSDPAPIAEGSMTGIGEKARGDGTKDDWAICAVMIRMNGQRREHILMDGDFSKQWTITMGMDVACDFMKFYNTPYCMHEAYGGLTPIYDGAMKTAVRTNGVRYSKVEMTGANRTRAKNTRFGALAAMAAVDEFFISEKCSREFKEKFLEQCRNWKPLPGGRNSNKFDDCADVVSMITNSGIQAKVHKGPRPTTVWNPVGHEDDEEYQPRSRYCVA